jgi:GAF domain-containing protein
MEDMAVRLQDVAATLDDLRTLLDGEEGIDQVLDRLVETARRAIPAAVAVSVTVVADEGNSAWTATATDAAVVARTRRPVRVGVEDVRDKWPVFAKAATKAGMHSYLSAPLMLGDEPVLGALNIYGRAPDAFCPVDEALMGLFTAAASATIVNARRYTRARDLAENMKTALDSRAEIDQAKGVLMAMHSISAKEAFQLLARESQDTNTKLRDVARSLLDTVTCPQQSA